MLQYDDHEIGSGTEIDGEASSSASARALMDSLVKPPIASVPLAPPLSDCLGMSTFDVRTCESARSTLLLRPFQCSSNAFRRQRARFHWERGCCHPSFPRGNSIATAAAVASELSCGSLFDCGGWL
eukprot:SAG31_NODE_136_length_23089_cov_8.825924_12_plen_126_part_00